MKDKKINRIIVILTGTLWFLLALSSWLSPTHDISASERRKLAGFPEFTLKSLVTVDFMEDFEQYAKDQFPCRFLFRTIKAYVRFYPLGQKDNNGIYIQDGYAVKMEYPLNEASIERAADKFRYLYEKYMEGRNVNVYLTIVPDKGYFLSKANGYPSMDYSKLFEMMKADTDFAEYIDISDLLEIDDYYKTDIHWKQERLTRVTDKIKSTLGEEKEKSGEYAEIETERPFYGVYYGHSALPMKPDKLKYLTSDLIDDCTVYNWETGKTTAVYDVEKLSGNDPYDVYLSGAAALLEISNPSVKNGKELVIFRDSFGSSLAPLLLDGYSKVTMIDIRYISSDLISDYITFDDQDVLFVYSTSVLNSSAMFK
uniref:DHHW family protein n=1 Tax=Clostridium sp. NkU-1 TaxID=1095009 RepID=UPI0006CF38B8